jgi:hypothetical protein
MTRFRRPYLVGSTLAAALCLPAAANAQTSPEQEAVIAAVVRFSVGYGAWIWEKKCQALTADQRREFDEVVADDLKRLTAAADAKLVNAVTTAGQTTAAGDKVPPCGGPDAAEFGQFGLKMAKEAQDKLKTLPAGYRMVIAD